MLTCITPKVIMHFFTHCVLACVLLYPIQSLKNYIQLCLNVYLCHVFNNTKIKAFLSYCCILCSRIPEHWIRYLTSMQKSSPLNLCSGSNIELNSPTSHTQTLWKNKETCMWWPIIICFTLSFTNFDSTQKTQWKKKPNVFQSLKEMLLLW